MLYNTSTYQVQEWLTTENYAVDLAYGGHHLGHQLQIRHIAPCNEKHGMNTRVDCSLLWHVLEKFYDIFNFFFKKIGKSTKNTKLLCYFLSIDFANSVHERSISHQNIILQILRGFNCFCIFCGKKNTNSATFNFWPDQCSKIDSVNSYTKSFRP